MSQVGDCDKGPTFLIETGTLVEEPPTDSSMSVIIDCVMLIAPEYAMYGNM